MATSIATLSVKLVASIGSFTSSMAAATKPVMSFASGVAGATSKIVGLAGAGAALIAGGSMAALVKNSLDSVDALKDQADALGVSTESLSRLQYAASFAGIENEALGASLGKMLKNIDDAKNGAGAAAGAFTTLGLDAAKLAGMAPDEAFREIAGAMAEVENPAQRMGLAMDVFGKSGAALIPVLNNGKEGLAELAAEADRFGVTIAGTDAEKIEAANDAMDRMKHAITGAANTLAIQLAPFIQLAADKLTDFITQGETGLTGKVVSGFEAVLKAVAYVADYVQLLPMGFYGFRAGALQALAGVLGGVDSLGAGLVDLLNLLPGVEVAWTDTFATLKQGMEQVAAEEAGKFDEAFGKFQRGDNAAAVTKWFDDIRSGAKAAGEELAKPRAPLVDVEQLEQQAERMAKVADGIADIKKSVEQFGLSDAQKKLGDLAAQGATADQLAQAKSLLAVQEQLSKAGSLDTGDPLADFRTKTDALLDLYNAGKIGLDQLKTLGESAKTTLNDKLAEQAKSVIDSVKTPVEAYTAEMEKLQTLLDQNLITRDVFDRAANAAKGKLNDAGAGTGEPAAPTLIRAGSAEAQRVAFDLSTGSQRMSKDDIGKKQLSETQLANRYLDRIERKLAPTSADDVQTMDIS